MHETGKGLIRSENQLLKNVKQLLKGEKQQYCCSIVAKVLQGRCRFTEVLR